MRGRQQKDYSSRTYHICANGMSRTFLLSCETYTAQRLGFTTFAPEVESVLKDHKQQQKVRHTIGAAFISLIWITRTGSRKESV